MSYLTLPSIVPPATVLPYAASNAPEGWLLCNGDQVSRTTYAALFSVIGTSYGQGDGTTTFNLPDYRWTFMRGFGENIEAIGTGTVIGNQATFTAHGFNRTGIKVRVKLGALSGLAGSTDYWVIVVNSNTLAFATTKANAVNNVRVAISGTNSAVISQHEDPDLIVRTANTTGANSGAAVGGFQPDKIGVHDHGGTRRSITVRWPR